MEDSDNLLNDERTPVWSELLYNTEQRVRHSVKTDMLLTACIAVEARSKQHWLEARGSSGFRISRRTPVVLRI